MDHVAIMNKQLGLIDHILSCQKTIETRWYKHRITPYDKIYPGDTIYFKDSGGLVRARATVSRFKQFDNLTLDVCQQIINQYGSVGLIDTHRKDVSGWAVGKKYAILIWLKDVKEIKPFNIDKKGFGSGAAWITIKNIDRIRLH